MVTFLFNSKVNLFRRSIENGDLMKENGFTLEALYSYRDAIEIMPLSNEGYIKAIATLIQLYEAEKDDKVRNLMMKELSEYGTALEKSSDKDSELNFILGQAFSLKGNHEKARLYFDRALYFYPLSAYYIHEIASYYASFGNIEMAMGYIRKFDPYIEKYRGPNNPRGIFVYKIRDLESDLQFAKGNRADALRIAQKNLQEANDNIYTITSARSRSFISREVLLKILNEKVLFYQNNKSNLN